MMTVSFRALEVLGRAVRYSNLTTASENVGLSQPQLSRYVQQLEEELDLQLLDRSSKRKAHWTPIAHELAKLYGETQDRLVQSLDRMQTNSRPTQIRAACLEGLAAIAIESLKETIKLTSMQEIHLDVYDQDELASKFTSGDLDLIWTFAVPGRSKPKYVRELGYQTLKLKKTNGDINIFSSYQFGRRRKGKAQKHKNFVSNSLMVREQWLSQVGGSGYFPTSIQKNKNTDSSPVLIIGSDRLHHAVWDELSRYAGLV